MGTKNYIGKVQPLTWCCVRRAYFSVTRRKVQDKEQELSAGTRRHAGQTKPQGLISRPLVICTLSLHQSGKRAAYSETIFKAVEHDVLLHR